MLEHRTQRWVLVVVLSAPSEGVEESEALLGGASARTRVREVIEDLLKLLVGHEPAFEGAESRERRERDVAAF